MEHYRYQYTKRNSKAAKSGAWWSRRHIATYMGPQGLDTLYDYMREQSWDLPKHIKRKMRHGKKQKRARPPPEPRKRGGK